MIPSFNDDGYLSAGIHRASLDEVVDRFGAGSELRRAQAQSLRWLLPLCRDAGVRRLIINGSFVTDVEEPNDVDCVLLQGDDYNPASDAAAELEQGLPFRSLQIVRQAAFDFLVATFFGTDRAGRPTGVVEVTLSMLKNDLELANTQAKLAELEHLIEASKSNDGPGAQTERRSLQQLANQLREEIVRYRAASTTPAS